MALGKKEAVRDEPPRLARCSLPRTSSQASREELIKDVEDLKSKAGLMQALIFSGSY